MKKSRKPVVIGCRYTGEPKTLIDTASGTYWEVLPKVEGHAAKLQAALLTKPKARRLSMLQRLCACRASLNPRTGVMRGAQ